MRAIAEPVETERFLAKLAHVIATAIREFQGVRNVAGRMVRTNDPAHPLFEVAA